MEPRKPTGKERRSTGKEQRMSTGKGQRMPTGKDAELKTPSIGCRFEVDDGSVASFPLFLDFGWLG